MIGRTVVRQSFAALGALFLVSGAFAQSDLICEGIEKGSWWDSSKDGCYKCPKGYKHDPRATYDTGACRRTDKREARYARDKNDRKQAGPVCLGGAWPSFHDKGNWPTGVCMKCPKGDRDDKDKAGNVVEWSPGGGAYEHDVSKYGTTDGVCHRERFAVPVLYRANVMGGELLQLCKQTVAIFGPGREVPKLLRLPKAELPPGIEAQDVLDAVTAFQAGLPKGQQAALKKVAELARRLTPAVRRDLFDTDGLCDSESVLKKLKRHKLVPADWDETAYVAFSIFFDAGIGGGVQGGYVLVTNFDKSTLVLGVLGVTGSWNASVELTGGVQYFPSMDHVENFMGFGLGATAGVDVLAIGVGVDASFSVEGGKLKLQGIGPNMSIGVSPIPASVGMSGTYSWDMAKVKNY